MSHSARRFHSNPIQATTTLSDADRQQSADAAPSPPSEHDGSSLPDLRGVVPPFLRRLSSPRAGAQRSQSTTEDPDSVPFFTPHPDANSQSSLSDLDRQQTVEATQSSYSAQDNSLPDLRGVVPPFLRRLSSSRPVAQQPQSAADDANSVPFFASHPDADLQLPDILTQTVVSGSSIPFFANSPYGNNTPSKPHAQRQSNPCIIQSSSAATPVRPYTPLSQQSQSPSPSSQPSERVRRPSPPNVAQRMRRHSPPDLPRLPKPPTSHSVSHDGSKHPATASRVQLPPAPQLPQLPITPVSPRTPRASPTAHASDQQPSAEHSEARQLLPGENIRIDSVKSWGTFGDLQNSLSQTVLESSVELGERDAPVIDPAHLQVDFTDAEKRIGIGTYGSVYVGCYHGELVAVKRIRMPEVSSAMKNDANLEERQKEAMRQFAREIRRYERVSHPGIVHFLGVTIREQESTALIVTALMRGGSLGEALKNLRQERTHLDPSTLVRIALQTCGGLRALHSANFTWGDAKPDNILLSAPLEGGGTLPALAQARISDFGLSRSVGQSLLTDTTVAGSGEPAGTFNYMAPEAFAGVDPKKEDIAKASDIFSYGMVLYEMLTLRTPWRRRKMFDVYAALMKGERPEWPKETDDDFFHEVPKALRELVESCWAQRPLDRLTADELFRKLDEASFTLNIREGQRPVSDITNPMGESDINIARTSGMIHSLSKRSSTSTAVAICEDSVDLSDSALESSGDSATFDDESEHDLVSNDSGDAMDYVNGNPRVSPVSSLETKAVDGLHGPNRTNPQFQDAQTPQGGSFKATKGRVTQATFVAIDSEVNIQTEKIVTESKIASVPKPKAAPTAEEEIFDNFVQEDLHAVPTTDFIQYRDKIAQHFAEAAFHLSNIDDSEPLSNEMKYVTEQRASPENDEVQDSNLQDSVEGRPEDSGTVNPSPATLRRKRSKRLQNIIEHAALAFLELQRREDRVNKTPPKVRKEAAERKAEEEARQLSEHETLRIIDKAQSNGDYTTILERVQNNRKSHVIVKAGCSFLEAFCRNESLYFDLCEEGVVEEYISAASLFGKQDAVLCTVFCNSMASLSRHFDDKVGHLIRGVGVPSMVIEVLEYHKTDVPLQIAGCSCLGAIAASSELSRSAVATLGGPGAVYRAITKNNSSFKDVELAKASLKAIRHIALDNQKAAEYLVEVAALDPVSRAAEVFTDHGLEQDILDALQAFSFYNGGRRNIIMSSGLKALTAIMLRNRDPRFLVQCCIFVRSIARWRDRDCEDAMLQSSISERVTSLIRASNDILGDEGSRVAWYACNACTFLASFGSRSRKRLRRVGAIETVLDLLCKRRENHRVVHSATDAVAELIKNEPEGRAVAEAYNVIPILTNVLELHKNEAKVKNAILWTLHYLVSPNEGPFGPAPGSQAHQEVIKKLMLRYGQKPPAQTNQKRRIFRFGWKRNERGKVPS